jgi:hypothetical protein
MLTHKHRLLCVLYCVIYYHYRSGDEYDRDEDHLAQCIELLGRFPKRLTTEGNTQLNVVLLLCSCHTCIDLHTASHIQLVHYQRVIHFVVPQ